MSQSYAAVLKSSVGSAKYESSGQRVPRKNHESIMIKNNADGFTYKVSDKELIERILILGTNSNTYYSSSSTLTSDSINSIKRMIADGQGKMIIDVVRDVYESGRAPKLEPTFFVIALLTQSSVPLDVRMSALDMVANLRTFSHLYTWQGMRKTIGEDKKQFGRGVRTRLLKLFKSRTGKQFAYQATKYRSRKFGEESWSIDDIVKLAHIPSRELAIDSQAVLIYIIKGIDEVEKFYCSSEKTDDLTNVVSYLRAVEGTKSESCTNDTAVQLIREYNLPREVVNTKLLNDVNVWNALLFKTTVGEGGKIDRKVLMPITALFRNLGVMSQRGVFDNNDVAELVAKHIKSEHILRKGRVHPVAILVAKTTYDNGKGLKGSLVWTVNKTISNALEEAFYTAFGTIEGTGKRIMHAVDCSGSMSVSACAVPNLTACQAVSTLVMEAVRREYNHAEKMLKNGITVPVVQDVMLFNHSSTMVKVLPTHKLYEVFNLIQQSNFGATDCALPMVRALEKYLETKGKMGLYDMFIVYTDNESYYGNIHPSEALDRYREATGIDAKLVVVATTPTSNTIGYGETGNVLNPVAGMNENFCLNIAGFDLNGPTLIRNFSIGTLGTTDVEQTPECSDDDGFELVDC